MEWTLPDESLLRNGLLPENNMVLSIRISHSHLLFHNSMRLRELVPEDILFVSESGIRTNEDIQALAAKQVDAVLVGETMMRASKDANALQSMIQAGKIKVR